MERRSVYAVFIWHAFFLALTLSMLNFGTVLPALVDELTSSKTVFGLLYSILLAGPYLFNVIFGHFLSSFRYRRKFLLLGIYARSLSFLGMALFMFFFASHSPGLVVLSLFFWLTLFSLSGGLAGLVYSDIVAKLLPGSERGTIYAVKQLVAGGASVAGGLLVARILGASGPGFPSGYAVLLMTGFAGLIVAAAAFWFIREPPSLVEDKKDPLIILLKKIPRLLRDNPEFRRFVIVENMSGFGLMILPFYMLFAKENFDLGGSYVGHYLVVQTSGILLSNFLWGAIARQWGSKAVVRTCLLIGAVTPLMALLLVKYGPVGFYPVFFMVGFMYSGRLVGFEPYLLDIVPEAGRSLFLGIRGSLDVLIALLPPLGGLFVDILGFRPLFFIVTAVLLSAFLLLGNRDYPDLSI